MEVTASKNIKHQIIEIDDNLVCTDKVHVDRFHDIMSLCQPLQILDESLNVKTLGDIGHILRSTLHLLPIEYRLSPRLSCTPSSSLPKKSNIRLLIILRVLNQRTVDHRAGTISAGFPMSHQLTRWNKLFLTKSTFNNSLSALLIASIGSIAIIRFVSDPCVRFVNVIESLLINTEIPSLFIFRRIQFLKMFIFRHRRRSHKHFGAERHHKLEIKSLALLYSIVQIRSHHITAVCIIISSINIQMQFSQTVVPQFSE